MKKLILTVALCASLASCSTPAPKPPPMTLDYSSMGSIYLDVQNFNVVDRSSSTPVHKPYIGHMFKPSVSDAVHTWADDRLKTTGKPGRAVLVIKEASVTEQPLQLATGMDSWFRRQQSRKYTAKVEVDIEARSGDGYTSAFATAHAARSVTLPEDPTEVEKAKAYNDLLNGLMGDLDKNLDQSIRQHLAKFITR
ncbi:MAG: hypothetical protein PHX43_03480 [Alphaproteobacteria bacterium]|nr:hypothetical protein [Alphaproteobacteria bacterium]